MTVEGNVTHSNLVRLLAVAVVAGLGDAPAPAAPGLRPDPDPGWIRVRVVGMEGKAVLFRPDGTGRTEVIVANPVGQPSPDGKSTLSVRSVGGNDVVFVADADGKNERAVSPDKAAAGWPCWSPDGKRIAFLAHRGGGFQAHLADPDGRNLKPVSDAQLGVVAPRFAPGGRLSYLTLSKRGKLTPTDLVVTDGTQAKTLATETMISDHAWSPDGKVVAYGRPGALVFLDVGANKEQAVAYEDIDARVSEHMATQICWSLDGKAVACTIAYYGQRQANGPPMFGDDELFVVPRAGKPTWFRTDVKAQGIEGIEWVKRDAMPPR
jgi:dipeptidyl aminopeptidase/acylaminoacyl peptidase